MSPPHEDAPRAGRTPDLRGDPGTTGPADADGELDLASRRLGGSVVAASDETFAPKESLVLPAAPRFVPGTFGPRGQVYDGWETRRRREPGQDWAIVRLGVPGVVSRVLVDTAHFTGNFPESCTVDGRWLDGYPGPAELLADGSDWAPLVPRRALRGDAGNEFPVAARELVSHVRLTIAPDGGVARLRVYGAVLPDPRRLAGVPVDLAAAENGGWVEDCSDRYYADSGNLLLPGLAATMGEGWETRRRRGGGNDWVRLRLAAAGRVRQVVVDTTHFVGNAPGAARILGCDATAADPADPASWWELLPRTALQPDTRHWVRVEADRRATHARLDAYPDGGLARLRLYGELTADGAAALARRWWNALPATAAAALLVAAGRPHTAAQDAAAARPATDLPPELRRTLGLPGSTRE